MRHDGWREFRDGSGILSPRWCGKPSTFGVVGRVEGLKQFIVIVNYMGTIPTSEAVFDRRKWAARRKGIRAIREARRRLEAERETV